MRTLALSVTVLVFLLTSCGEDGPTEDEIREAEAFCTSQMGLEEYEDSVGFDRCVDDAAKVTECLIVAGLNIDGPAFVPSACKGDQPVP